jgi:hypothetical protein
VCVWLGACCVWGGENRLEFCFLCPPTRLTPHERECRQPHPSCPAHRARQRPRPLQPQIRPIQAQRAEVGGVPRRNDGEEGLEAVRGEEGGGVGGDWWGGLLLLFLGGEERGGAAAAGRLCGGGWGVWEMGVGGEEGRCEWMHRR